MILERFFEYYTLKWNVLLEYQQAVFVTCCITKYKP